MQIRGYDGLGRDVEEMHHSNAKRETSSPQQQLIPTHVIVTRIFKTKTGPSRSIRYILMFLSYLEYKPYPPQAKRDLQTLQVKSKLTPFPSLHDTPRTPSVQASSHVKTWKL